MEQAYLDEANFVESGDVDADDEQRTAILAKHKTSIKRWEMLGMFLVTTGGGVGLVCFGPISQRIGRRAAFFWFQAGAVTISLVVFQLLNSVETLIVALPVFGFLTLGIHAGFAVYFPELYPTRLRATGAGFCFNGGRLIAAPALPLIGLVQDQFAISPFSASTLFSLLFLVGIVVLAYAPETRGRELPE